MVRERIRVNQNHEIVVQKCFILIGADGCDR